MRKIAPDLKPTFENVSLEFIAGTIEDFLFSKHEVNFKFDFREKEALDFIQKQLNKYASKNDFFKENSKKVMKALQEKTQNNDTTPVLVVKDYKKFFEFLRQIYEKNIELYFKRTEDMDFPKYEMRNCFLDIWLRATPVDFNNPEAFLEKQAKMLKDTTFNKFDKETVLGEPPFLKNMIVTVKNNIARTWDEAFKQMEIVIYDKQKMKYSNSSYVPQYMLPVIRYGIYEKDGKKICHIGSIQNLNVRTEKNDLYKKINRKKYTVNDEVPEEYKDRIEPKNIVALSVFISMLNKEGITNIEIPSMYVLDYEYHEKRNKFLIDRFNNKWNPKMQEDESKWYEIEKDILKTSCASPDLVSEIKTERLLKNFERALYHFPKGKVTSFPDDADNYLHINIPVVKNKEDINGKAVREMYDLVGELYKEKEIER